jgi:hypothetical protein
MFSISQSSRSLPAANDTCMPLDSLSSCTSAPDVVSMMASVLEKVHWFGVGQVQFIVTIQHDF